MTSEEILNRLEEAMSELEDYSGATFEILEDYWALADARLSVYATKRMWVIAIEAVRYDARSDEFNLDIWLYGNCLRPRADFTDLSRPLLRTPNAWNRQLESGVWGFACDGFSICWRGRRFDFSPSVAELEAAALRLSRHEQQSGVLSPVQVLRFLCHHLDHPFFASEDALRDLLDARCFDSAWTSEVQGGELHSYFETEIGHFEEHPILSCDLELVLQTREWCHPRQGVMPEERISVCAAFEPLAQALATGDFTIWHNQDPARFNSHWTHWAETEQAAQEAWEQNQLVLGEEGRRFQDWVAARLSPVAREELLQNLQQEWQQLQRELQASLPQHLTHGIFITTTSKIEVAGQTFTFGPHLWGEMDTADYPYPGATAATEHGAIAESNPPSPSDQD